MLTVKVVAFVLVNDTIIQAMTQYGSLEARGETAFNKRMRRLSSSIPGLPSRHFTNRPQARVGSTMLEWLILNISIDNTLPKACTQITHPPDSGRMYGMALVSFPRQMREVMGVISY